MHYQLEINKHPYILEKIIKYCNIFLLPIDPNLIDQTESIISSFDESFPLKFDDLHRKIYRFVESNQGRGLIIDKPQFSSRIVSCAWVYSNNLFPLVICSNKKNYTNWKYLISKFFPEKNLIISDDDSPAGDFDVLLTTPKHFIHNNFHKKLKVQQILIDDIVHPVGIIGLRNNEIFKGISSEYYQTLFLLNLESLDTRGQYLKEDNIEKYCWHNYKSLISEIVDDFLVPKLKFNSLLSDKILNQFNITEDNSIEFLKLLGVNTDLLNKKHVSYNIKIKQD